MKRVKNFGDLSVDKQLDLLEDGLEKKRYIAISILWDD